MSKNHPDSFKHANIRKAIKRYKMDFKISIQHAKKKNHIILSYKDFCEKPDELKQLCWRKHDLSNTHKQEKTTDIVQEITMDNEKWKQKNKAEIVFQTGNYNGLTSDEITILENEKPNLDKLYQKIVPYFEQSKTQ